ncbi:MAG TPA: hypothetical protein VF943_10380, partial [Burkholderiales bacterium]
GNIIQTTDPAVAAERDRRFLDGGKEEMVNLSPPLGPGFHQDGRIYPQPVLPDGRRLDEAIGGYHFALLCPTNIFVKTEMNVIPVDGPEAVVLRPDRYIYGTARSAAELNTLLEGIRHESQTAESSH